LQLTEYLVVPETHDPVSHSFKSGDSPGIVCGLIAMLSPVSFDNQSCFQAYKIDNVRLNHYLASELVSCQPASSQVFPQGFFRLAGLAAKCAGTLI